MPTAHTPVCLGTIGQAKGIVLDNRAAFFRLCRSVPEGAHRLAWEGAVMENVLVAAVALFLGFNLGVLVVKLHRLPESDEAPGRVRVPARAVSAWWR